MMASSLKNLAFVSLLNDNKFLDIVNAIPAHAVASLGAQGDGEQFRKFRFFLKWVIYINDELVYTTKLDCVKAFGQLDSEYRLCQKYLLDSSAFIRKCTRQKVKWFANLVPFIHGTNQFTIVLLKIKHLVDA